MRYKLPGPTGPRVSELSLGTMSFGDAWGFGADPLQPCAQAWDASSVHDPGWSGTCRGCIRPGSP